MNVGESEFLLVFLQFSVLLFSYMLVNIICVCRIQLAAINCKGCIRSDFAKATVRTLASGMYAHSHKTDARVLTVALAKSLHPLQLVEFYIRI